MKFHNSYMFRYLFSQFFFSQNDNICSFLYQLWQLFNVLGVDLTVKWQANQTDQF